MLKEGERIGDIPRQVGRGKGSVGGGAGKKMKVRETRKKQERKQKRERGIQEKEREAGEASGEECRPGGDFGNRTGCGGLGKAGDFRASRIGRATLNRPLSAP